MAAFTRQFLVQYARGVKDSKQPHIKKTCWPIVGRAFEDKKRITVKLDSLPIDKDWDGRLFLYEIKEEDDGLS